MAELKEQLIEPASLFESGDPSKLQAFFEQRVAAYIQTSNRRYIEPVFRLSDIVGVSRPPTTDRQDLDRFVSLLVQKIILTAESRRKMREIVVVSFPALPVEQTLEGESSDSTEIEESQPATNPRLPTKPVPKDSRKTETEMRLSSPPKFDEKTPWRVLEFKVSGANVEVKVKDSDLRVGTLEFNHDQLKLIQYVGHEHCRKLYAEIRRAPKGLFLGPPHQIVYLGDVEKNQFPELRAQLQASSIDWVWYPTPRREKVQNLLPRTWKPTVN